MDDQRKLKITVTFTEDGRVEVRRYRSKVSWSTGNTNDVYHLARNLGYLGEIRRMQRRLWVLPNESDESYRSHLKEMGLD